MNSLTLLWLCSSLLLLKEITDNGHNDTMNDIVRYENISKEI